MKVFDWCPESTFFSQPKTEWKLETMFNALEKLDNPHLKLQPAERVIHIAGTNGKGSTANFVRCILEKSGYKVGMFTSPHLINYNERIYIAGRHATDAEIVAAKEQICAACRDMLHEISYFEITTLIAILLFLQAKPQLYYYIFEVGLGGRLDATNIFPQVACAAITSISFDHTAQLGNTLAQIAREKGGIIKPNCPVFTSNTNPEITDELRKIAAERHAKLYIAGRDYEVDNSIHPSLLGAHQIENANLAAAVCKYLASNGVANITKRSIFEGIQSTRWSCRMQKIVVSELADCKNIVAIYLDGAHNEDGILALCNFAKQVKSSTSADIIGVFACLKRKDYKSFFPILKTANFDKLLFYNVPPSVNDFVAPSELKQLAREHDITCAAITKLAEISNFLKQNRQTTIFIFGSLYFAGWILEQTNNHAL